SLAEKPRTLLNLRCIGRRMTLSDGGAWDGTPHTSLVFTGAFTSADRDELQSQLDGCRVSTKSSTT
ncbi:MAG: GTP-binding protein, partial [Caldilinea sp.]|nr:GTP-binding protein [Caldilinea sp.]